MFNRAIASQTLQPFWQKEMWENYLETVNGTESQKIWWDQNISSDRLKMEFSILGQETKWRRAGFLETAPISIIMGNCASYLENTQVIGWTVFRPSHNLDVGSGFTSLYHHHSVLCFNLSGAQIWSFFFLLFLEMCSELLFLIKVDEDISTHTTYYSGIKLTFKWYLMD